MTLDRAFNAYGETDGETTTVNGSVIGSWQVTQRDLGGKILEKTETLGGTTVTHAYTYCFITNGDFIKKQKPK